MRFFIFLLAITFSFSLAAQDPSVDTANQGFYFKVNKKDGLISLFQKGQEEAVTGKYKLSRLEVEIFDAKGEYAGTLELKQFAIPKDEIESYEKLKIAAVVMQDTATGKKVSLNNVAIVENK